MNKVITDVQSLTLNYGLLTTIKLSIIRGIFRFLLISILNNTLLNFKLVTLTEYIFVKYYLLKYYIK